MWQSPYHHHHSLGGLLDQPQPPQQQNGKEPLTAKYCLLCEDHHVVTSHCRWQILKHIYIRVVEPKYQYFFRRRLLLCPFFWLRFQFQLYFYNYIPVIIVPYKRDKIK